MQKSIKKFLGIILIAAGLTASARDGAEDWAKFKTYEDSNKELALDSVSPRVVFMGNSITELWVKKHLEFFTENQFIGRGISSQTSYQMLLRFREDVINLHPDYVVINAGTNDIAENNHPYNEQRTLGNIISMAELAQANGIRPILSSVLPCNRIYWRDSIKDVAQKVKSLNEKIRKYAESNGICFIDYHTSLADEKDGLAKAFTEDGVHPNLEGYLRMETAAMEQINGMTGGKY